MCACVRACMCDVSPTVCGELIAVLVSCSLELLLTSSMIDEYTNSIEHIDKTFIFAW